jgi:hypothetical protein
MEEITPEKIAEVKKMLEQRVIRAKEIEQKKKELNRHIKNSTFPLKDINWHLEMKDIDFSLSDYEGKENKEYEIINLPTDKVAHFYIKDADKKFPKDKLFGIRTDAKIIRLIEYLQQGGKVTPPIIRYIDYKLPIMFDQGNHRFALSRFLKLNDMPFIIEKKDIEKIKALFD